MTGAEVLNLVMFRLQHREDPVLRAAALQEMKLVQTTFEQGTFLPWFLYEWYSDAAFKTTIGAAGVTLPTGFLGLDEEVRYIFRQDPTSTADFPYVAIPFGDAADVITFDKDAGAGVPRNAWLDPTAIGFRPYPDAEYLLLLPCYRGVTSVDDSTMTNAWTTNAADWLAAETLVKVATFHTRDLQLAQFAQADAEKARRRVYVQHQARIHTARSYIIGGTDK